MTELNMDYQYDNGARMPSTIPPRAAWDQVTGLTGSPMPVQQQTRIHPLSSWENPWTQYTGAAWRFQDHPEDQQQHPPKQDTSSSYAISTTAPSFQDFRSQNSMSQAYSDCLTKYSETVITDSGYATVPGLDDLAMGGAVDPDVRSIACRLDTVNVASDSNPPSTSQSEQTQARPRTTPSERGAFYCESCDRNVKSRAELNKHTKRHFKPYKCEVPGCKRKFGFSSETDLNRHKVCVHKNQHLATKEYKCDLGSCREKDKKWLRRDNFANHLKSKHRISPNDIEEQLERLRCRPEAPSRLATWVSDHGQDLRYVGGVGRITGVHNPYYVDSTPGFQTTTGALAVAQPEEEEQGQGDEDPESDLQLDYPDTDPAIPQSLHQFKHLFLPSDIDEEILSLSHRPSSGPKPGEQAATEDEDADMDDPLASLVEESADAPVDNPAPGPSPAMTENKEDIIKILDNIDPGFLEKYVKSKLAPPALDAEMGGAESREEKKRQHPCRHPRCSRAFERQCELNKHMRRHEKPYGCTFPRCESKFGSKSDWRRHENSQHFQLEMWKCDAKLPGGDVCPRACHRREVFLQHLENDHGVTELAELEHRQERCRVDRNSETRFWCGFCEMVLTVEGGGGRGVDGEEVKGAWSERYDHIGDHFTGRDLPKKDIKEWKGGDSEYNELDLGGKKKSSSGEEDEGGGASLAGQKQKGKRRRAESDSSTAEVREARTKKKARH